MEERGRGFPVGGGVVPIVPAAVVFDLAPLGRFGARPTAAMAYDAADRATSLVEEGSVGAGTGTTVGKAGGIAGAMKGGVGAAVSASGAIRVGALAVVNAFGDVRDAAGRIIAGARRNGEFADSARILREETQPPRFGQQAIQNTTLCVVISSVPLQRVELQQLAAAASAALLRRITPAGTTFDGDAIFAVSPLSGTPASALRIEALAVAALEEAIERAVMLARGRDGVPAIADLARSPTASGARP
jgi:L-aminopeptidase/D-esterase-like protein